jgi:hydroxymethylglutaryl-CoA reductase
MTTPTELAGFRQNTLIERQAQILTFAGLNASSATLLDSGGLSTDVADHMVENAVGIFGLPLGIATNFLINGREIAVPMVIEEPSVVAGASHMAKLARSGGGFIATTDAPEMIGQIQILDVSDVETARQSILEHRAEILAAADVDAMLVNAGGGPRDIEVRVLKDPKGVPFLVLHLIIDVRDAMGANAVNTACERVAPLAARLAGGRAHLRILSNLADRRLARAQCSIPISALTFGDWSGERVRDGVLDAYAFAAADPYRAATHNKGVMNGVDAVVIATGNDWRAVEAGAHAYAARRGRYEPLTTWECGEHGELVGRIEMPMAVGIVGGATRVHPLAQTALRMLGVHTATELADIIVSVGLAQNLAALRALATEGIQRGHMGLHARQVAMAAGASGEWADRIADRLVAEGTVRIDRANELLREFTGVNQTTSEIHKPKS